MKLQIITLEPEDDQASARDKLAWSKSTRALLVWPRRGRVLTRRLDLALLQRQAERQGIQLGLVTFDPQILAHAHELGIPVFETPDHLPEAGWSIRKRDLPPRPGAAPLAELSEAIVRQRSRPTTLVRFPPADRWVAPGLALVALLALAAALGPRAVISLSPARQVQSEGIEITLDPDLPEVQRSGALPAEVITFEISGESRSATSGSSQVPKISAVGTVLITNLTADALMIPAGTGLRASQDQVRFQTLEGAELAPQVGSISEVDIAAVLPGASGNLPAGAIDAVEGNLGFLVTVTNEEPTRGGVSERSSAVSAADRSRLRLTLRRELLDQAWQRMSDDLEAGQVVARDSLAIVETIREDFDADLGQAAVSLGLTTTIRVEALAFRISDLETLASSMLAEGLPTGYLPVPGTIRVAAVADSATGSPSESALMNWKAQQYIARELDFTLIRNSVRGLPIREAAARLAARYDLAGPPRVNVFPNWYPWLPWLPMRIEVDWAWEGS